MLGLREVCGWFAGAQGPYVRFACGLREPKAVMVGLRVVCLWFAGAKGPHVRFA